MRCRPEIILPRPNTSSSRLAHQIAQFIWTIEAVAVLPSLPLPPVSANAARPIEPNVTTTRYVYMAQLSPDQKRTDLLFGSTALGVLLFTAISGLLLWLVTS